MPLRRVRAPHIDFSELKLPDGYPVEAPGEAEHAAAKIMLDERIGLLDVEPGLVEADPRRRKILSRLT